MESLNPQPGQPDSFLKFFEGHHGRFVAVLGAGSAFLLGLGYLATAWHLTSIGVSGPELIRFQYVWLGALIILPQLVLHGFVRLVGEVRGILLRDSSTSTNPDVRAIEPPDANKLIQLCRTVARPALIVVLTIGVYPSVLWLTTLLAVTRLAAANYFVYCLEASFLGAIAMASFRCFRAVKPASRDVLRLLIAAAVVVLTCSRFTSIAYEGIPRSLGGSRQVDAFLMRDVIYQDVGSGEAGEVRVPLVFENSDYIGFRMPEDGRLSLVPKTELGLMRIGIERPDPRRTAAATESRIRNRLDSWPDFVKSVASFLVPLWQLPERLIRLLL